MTDRISKQQFAYDIYSLQ